MSLQQKLLKQHSIITMKFYKYISVAYNSFKNATSYILSEHFQILFPLPHFSVMDQTKYDRQIRLFGEETQQKLFNLKVQVLGTSNPVSMEIIKNIVLLGVQHIVVEEEMIEEVKKFIPNSLKEINENLKIEYSTAVQDSNFLFVIDNKLETKENIAFYFICSKCFTIKFSNCCHECKESVTGMLLAKHCLVGAYAVQEFIKYIQGKSYTHNFVFKF